MQYAESFDQYSTYVAPQPMPTLHRQSRVCGNNVHQTTMHAPCQVEPASFGGSMRAHSFAEYDTHPAYSDSLDIRWDYSDQYYVRNEASVINVMSSPPGTSYLAVPSCTDSWGYNSYSSLFSNLADVYIFVLQY